MHCANCGRIIDGGAAYCLGCGERHNSGIPSATPAPAGFSIRISNPAFAAYKRKSGIWSILFALILAVIALIGFPIYGNASGEIEWPSSLYYGFGIGGMFIAIALIQILKRALDKTWDGTVENKKTYKQRERVQGGYTFHTYYTMKVRKDSGGVKKHKWRDTPGLYDYYNTGDRVRHHKGFYYYEKYDKSQDAQIMCAACMSFIDKNEDICPRCKCPLLK